MDVFHPSHHSKNKNSSSQADQFPIFELIPKSVTVGNINSPETVCEPILKLATIAHFFHRITIQTILLHQNWRTVGDLNPRPLVLETAALPLS
jgi:hypothetical protein